MRFDLNNEEQAVIFFALKDALDLAQNRGETAKAQIRKAVK